MDDARTARSRNTSRPSGGAREIPNLYQSYDGFMLRDVKAPHRAVGHTGSARDRGLLGGTKEIHGCVHSSQTRTSRWRQVSHRF